MPNSDNPFRTNPISIGKYQAKFQNSAAQAGDFFGLSNRELELLDCLAMGLSGPQAAAKMGVSINTINTYKERCVEKMGVPSVAVCVHLVIAYCSGAELEKVA